MRQPINIDSVDTSFLGCGGATRRTCMIAAGENTPEVAVYA